MLKGKTVVVGVTGGIAAYKTCTLVSTLVKHHANVFVVMTKNATEFVAPLTFETLSSNRVIIDSFDRNFDWNVKHVSLAKAADVFVVAPATANIIAKLSAGECNDFLTTCFLACTAKKIIAPAMNDKMISNPITLKNINSLACSGCDIIYGDDGRLACGDNGSGRMAEPEDIFEAIKTVLSRKNDFAGKNILITAGATIEDIDGARCITNYSSGKMGLAIAKCAANRGAQVTLIKARTDVVVDFSAKIINVKSTQDMFDAVIGEYVSNDIIIKAAAPADYRLKEKFSQKIKSDTLTLELVKNPDIAAKVGQLKENRKLVIFSAETENLIKNAQKKLVSKNADMVVANDITLEGAGFNTDTNIVTIITKDKKIDIPKTSKIILADIILDNILELS